MENNIEIKLNCITNNNLKELIEFLDITENEFIQYLINKEYINYKNNKLDFIKNNYVIKKTKETEKVIEKMKPLIFNTIFVELKEKINEINKYIFEGNEILAKQKLDELEKNTNMPELLYKIKECRKEDLWKKYNEFLEYFKVNK